jgi:hypothetical protein
MACGDDGQGRSCANYGIHHSRTVRDKGMVNREGGYLIDMSLQTGSAAYIVPYMHNIIVVEI